MDFRRSGTIDERRRRVLMDEIASPASDDDSTDAASTGAAPKGPVRAYSPAVLEERLPLITSLIPLRPSLATIVVLLGITAVSLLETIHIYARTLPIGNAAQLATFDATARGNLAAWFSSIVLALAAGGAVTVYLIRRHRVDDYRGRYRVWLWVAGVLGWASLDAATGMHDALGLGIALLAGTPLASPTLGAACTISWLTLYGLVLGTLAIRASIEIWPSLPAFSALAVGSLLYFLGGLAELEILTSDSPLVASVLATSAVLLANVAVASSVLLFARHVHLDAQGRLKVYIDPAKRRKAKPKSKARLKVVKEDKEESKPAEKIAAAASKPAQPATTTSQPRFGLASSSGSSNAPAAKAAATVTKAATSSNYGDDEEDDDADGEGDDRLSKSERRRLKKMARRGEQGRRAA